MNLLDKIKAFFGGSKPASVQNESFYTGVIKKFHYKKGFGFIGTSDFEGQVFVHKSDADFKIHQNDKVSFKIEDTDKGPRAVEVTLIEKGRQPQRNRKSRR